jgi:chromate reductase, NAD(P)H dehydrogenase (quinone)
VSAKEVTMPTDTVTVLGIAGSLRQGSYNRALLRSAQSLVPDGMTLRVFELHGIPFYDADVEKQGNPDPVNALKRQIREADGVLIATPEYQHSLPGVLKNALDWASRPTKDPALKGKPVAMIGATTGRYGTARAQAELRKVLAYNDAVVINRPEVLVANAAQTFDDAGQLADETARELLRQLLETLGWWARLLRDAPPRS